MVQVREGSDPLLKRPFSLFRKTEEGIQLLYRIQGKGTTILGGLAAGAPVNLLGPLGNGYPAPGPASAPVVIAGGIGIASVFPLIESMAGKATVLYGARTGDDLLLLDELKALSGNFDVCTDDGSRGEKGNVLDLLNRVLPPDSGSSSQIYACGPKPMLRAVSGFAVARGIKAYLSLEEHMACGIGACLGCVVKIKARIAGGAGQGEVDEGAYQRVCMEGPVFSAEDIVW